MNPGSLFFDHHKKQIRSGWRVLIFSALLIAPQILLASHMAGSDEGGGDAVFEVSFGMIATYGLIIVWAVFVSWICLRFLERMPLSSLGFDLRPGWWREVVRGIVLGAAMVVTVVILQAVGGGTRVAPNAIWWKTDGLDFAGLLPVARDVIAALALLILAGAFEEIIYRGYPFQTLLRGAPVVVPILLFSIIFGFAHWDNPSRTFFSTANTILAGVWLSIAYLKTRRLWFPTALHFTWNWMMGAFFGLPVSGITIPQNPILLSTSHQPLWLTGGSYGAEGGAATSLVLIVSILIILRLETPDPPPDHHS
ncbi:MAG: CPBP family intramembrane metalloprotease [Acidobacteriota bacterium]|nr:MAG: CPBP family intramembrane metalloprotease [Acidobacteriota bacterium]